MKKNSTFLLVFCSISHFWSQVAPTKDFNNFFVSFQDGFFRQIEIQPVISYKAGDELVAYIDTRGNLRLFNGVERKDVTALNVQYEVSDHLLAYKIAGALKMWDAGKFQTLTTFAKDFTVKDSIIVYQDSRYNSLSVYCNKQIFPVLTYFSEFAMPTTIGENIAIFKDNSNTYHAFWNGKTYEIGTFNEEIMNFDIGTDVFCYKDPYSQTFIAFDKGEFLEIESLPIKKYKSGRGFIIYEDLNGNLWHYGNQEKKQLSNFSTSFWDVKDDMTIWAENSYLFSYSNGQKQDVATYIPTSYLIKNNVFAFKNLMGGVSAIVNNKLEEITNMPDSEFEIYGNKVLVRLPNKSLIILNEGKKYNN